MSVYLVIFSCLLENVPFDWFLLCMYNNAFKKLLKADTNLQSHFIFMESHKRKMNLQCLFSLSELFLFNLMGCYGSPDWCENFVLKQYNCFIWKTNHGDIVFFSTCTWKFQHCCVECQTQIGVLLYRMPCTERFIWDFSKLNSENK